MSFNLEPSQISAGARSIVETLQRAGYTAYVVGGCVRDLLLNLRPKDFDVATDATPEEVHALFRGSRMIGRRFRLVHVRKGREIIEVSTFRGLSGDQETAHNENVFGSFEEDAFRRDFTINALYFDPIGNALLDPTERGLLDITDRALTIIGDPTTRIIEDPVRMIRAARFAAKLNFRID
ncbi:MAG: polynucleotide adenylyltransferase PcnB, partial [Pseudomonadales bacterium]